MRIPKMMLKLSNFWYICNFYIKVLIHLKLLHELFHENEFSKKPFGQVTPESIKNQKVKNWFLFEYLKIAALLLPY